MPPHTQHTTHRILESNYLLVLSEQLRITYIKLFSSVSVLSVLSVPYACVHFEKTRHVFEACTVLFTAIHITIVYVANSAKLYGSSIDLSINHGQFDVYRTNWRPTNRRRAHRIVGLQRWCSVASRKRSRCTCSRIILAS